MSALIEARKPDPTIRPRDVVVTFRDKREGKPYEVMLRHKPTGRQVEGTGETVLAAREDAERLLLAAVLS